MSVAQRVAEQYPMFKFLLKDPEVGLLLIAATDPNKGFSPQKFQADLYKTKWFKKRSVAQRNYEILANTDKGEFRRILNKNRANIRANASNLGMKLSKGEVNYMAHSAMRSGHEPDSKEARFAMYNWAKKQSPRRLASGAALGAAHQAQEIARGQYYLNLDAKTRRNWGLAIALGVKDQSALKQEMAFRALGKYPHLKAQLMNGQTMEDIFGGHRQMIAEQLDLAPNQIDFTNSKWNKVISHYDKNTKSTRPYTLHEARTLARQDRRFWNSTIGREQSNALSNKLLETFGMRA